MPAADDIAAVCRMMIRQTVHWDGRRKFLRVIWRNVSNTVH